MHVLDVEGHLTGPGKQAPPIVCVSNEHGEVFARPEARYQFEVALAEGVTNQAIAFDLACAISTYGMDMAERVWDAYDNGRVKCTRVRDMLTDIRDGKMQEGRKYSLEAIAKRRIGVDISDSKSSGWRFRYSELDGQPVSQYPKEAVSYASGDGLVTKQVWDAQDYESPDEDLQVRSAWAFQLMKCRGIRTDQLAVADLRKRLRKEVEVNYAKAEPFGLVVKEKGVWKRKMAPIRGRIEAILGDTASRTDATAKYPEGQIQTDAEALARCPGDKALQALSAAQSAYKELTTFVPHLRALVHPGWNVLVQTGRSSCRGPNLQQMPRRPGVRECFIARPGYVFVFADYSVAELCALAEVCRVLVGSSKLGAEIDAGKDPHKAFGAKLMGISYEEMLRRYAAKDPVALDMRQASKAANFGYPGGLGIKAWRDFARNTYNVILSHEEAKQLKKQWFKSYPEVQQYFNRFVRPWAERDYVTQLYSNRIRSRVTFPSAANTMFQGLVADGAKDALYDVTRECYMMPRSPLYGCRPVAFIHDEIGIEVPRGREHAATERLKYLMIRGMQRWIKSVKLGVDATTMDRWRKT